ncbi:MAG: endonuclease/exonuclease/phosphatase family protein [Bacteroidales bacterium]
MKAFRIVLRAVGVAIALVFIFLIVAVLVAVITDFNPPPHAILAPEGNPGKSVVEKSRISIMSWNIGYAGLGSDMDFFYDGGENVRPPKQLNWEYFSGITKFLQKMDTLDFMLLQEVDKTARRSHRQNQVEFLRNLLNGFQSIFARNYDVMFVPVPVNNPMGRVESGLMNFSVYDATTSERIDYPGGYGFPKRLFMLDRCFIIQRYVTAQGKLLAVVNTHNSAFDDGRLRRQEFEFLREAVLEEYSKGHYVIVGGDWNRNPPEYDPEEILTGDTAVNIDMGNIPMDFMPEGWTWMHDETVPSNRWVNRPYKKATTKTTTIDFFLVSPNIKPLEVQTPDLGFRYSDHNPVIIRVELIN